MLSKENVYAKIKKSGNLPSLPEILLKLLEACDNETTSLPEIAEIISKDPALSFRVLQLVNSANYGLCRNFISVDQAVIYLGAKSIKNIAVTTCIHQVFEGKRFNTIKTFKISAFWWHSLMCATLSRRIAKKIQYANIDEAYLSGLLHDIGRLILISTFPEEHKTFLLETEDIWNELWAEKQLIGITHSEAGAWLVHNWNLNSLIADAIRYHHEPLEQIKEAFSLIKVVYLANLIRENSSDHERNLGAGSLLLGLDSDDIESIIEGATEEVLEIAENLNVNAKPQGTSEKSKQNSDESPAGQMLPEESIEDEDYQHNTAKSQDVLVSRIKNIALLSGFLENLVQAGDSEAIITVFEQSMSILFNIEKVLFFLPDKDGLLLKGRTSTTSELQHLSQSLALPVQRSSSQIVKAYLTQSLTYLTSEIKHDNLADVQLLSAFRSTTVLLVPIFAHKKPIGVILLGLPQSVKTLSLSDCKLVQVIAQQVGLCFFLENMQARKAEEIEIERKAAISMTARKFAHEINNPLGIISNYLTTLRLKLSKENDIQEELGVIGEEIHRISTMINQMDMFSSTVFPEMALTDVNAVIEDIIHIFKAPLSAASGTIITFIPDGQLPKILTSKDALKQIIINLLKNAAEAIVGGGNVAVRTGMLTDKPHDDEANQPEQIEIVVDDTGPGIPEAILKNLYKPFVTTKTSGHSGLGLSIVQKTVKDLGGSISCMSRPNAGTRFSIRLPLARNDNGLRAENSTC